MARSGRSVSSFFYPSSFVAGRRNAVVAKVVGETRSFGILVDMAAGLRVCLSDENHYLNVMWYAQIVCDPRGKDFGTFTTTKTHLPALAQEVEDIPNNPNSFRQPLARLNLDRDCISDDDEDDDDDASRNFSVDSAGQPRRYGRQVASLSALFTPRGMHTRRYLRTAPNKYLPIPTLIRTPHYYSFGRCPACSNNPPLRMKRPLKATIDSVTSKRSGVLERRPPKIIKNSTKNELLDHLAGKMKFRTTGGQRRESLKHLEKCMAEVINTPKSVSTKPRHFQEENNEQVDEYPSEAVDDNLFKLHGLVGAEDKKAAAEIFPDDLESLSTFASARQLESNSEVSIGSDPFTKRRRRLNRQRFTPRYQLKPTVNDLSEMYPGSVILASKLKDFDCHMPLIELDTEVMRELYKVTILKDNLLNRLYHRRNFKNLPPELQYLRKINFLRLHEARSVKIKDAEMDKDNHHFIMTYNYSKCILAELANQFYEVDNIHLGLFTNWLEKAVADKALFQLNTSREIGRLYQLIGDELRVSNFETGGTTRLEMLIIMATAAHDQKMRHQLWVQVRYWLEPLIGGLFATSAVVRDESCYTLAYLFSINTLVEDMRRSMAYDIPYDVTRNLLRAIDLHPESIMTFQVLMGYIVEGCPCISILNCLMEFGPVCKNGDFKQRWPLFIYYAVKHWDEMYLMVDAVYPALLMRNMVKAAMNPLTRKAAKLALIALARKFEKPMGAVTHWNTDWLKPE